VPTDVGPRRRSAHAGRRRGVGSLLVVLSAALAVVLAVRTDLFGLRGSPHAAGRAARSAGTPGATPPVTSPVTGPINPAIPGLTTFRGNATRTYYGEGPIPSHPVIRWAFPRSGRLCSISADNGITFRGPTQLWCGTGWTGQPNVIPRPNRDVEIRIGAYDGNYHFLDGRTGLPTMPQLRTGDLAKGSASSDADGYPLYYAGSRDNWFRIVALDRSRPTVLWKMNAMTSVPHPVWNNDWDGAALQLGDYLLEGGENSWFYVIRLNRHYDAQHLVEVDPRIVMRVPGWDARLLRALGGHDDDVSIENSVAFYSGVAYFANSAGLVQGWDISDVLRGGTHYRRVFRFWDGDETDATIVIDPQGYLYVSRHRTENVPSRPLARDHRVGDLMKLDPRHPSHPLVWSVQLGGFGAEGGLLGTPALYRGVLYADNTEGGLSAIDAATGQILWQIPVAAPTWSSPVAMDGQLLLGDGAGYLDCWRIGARRPTLRWRLHVGGIIESTPAVWHGWIYVGSRDGRIYGIADPGA
jgi:outer membrane protein assembly factor BamB